jgi:hypothetical protein
MHETGPNREPDKAFVRHWDLVREYQEHAERRIHTQDHLKIFRATSGMPRQREVRPNVSESSAPFEIAVVLVRLGHGASRIANTDQGISYPAPMPD